RRLDRQVWDCATTPGQNVCKINFPGNPPHIHGRSEGEPERGPHNWPTMFQYGSTDVDKEYALIQDLSAWVLESFNLNGANNMGGTGADPPDYPYEQTRTFAHIEGGTTPPQVPYCPHGAAFYTATGSITHCAWEVYNDIMAHEYAHAIILHRYHDGQGNPIGVYYFREPASLDESHSDIMGEIFEYDRTGYTDWINGSGDPYGIPFRNLGNPHAVINPVTNLPYPDRYWDANVYCGNEEDGGAHTNSTIPSHAIYLFARGGEFNGCEIQGQGEQIAKLVSRRVWAHLDRYDGFSRAYTAFQNACDDLGTLEQCSELTKALQAVEIDQGGRCSGSAERAPSCAVNHSGNLSTSTLDGTPSSIFNQGQPFVLNITGATGGRQMGIYLVPSMGNRPPWQEMAPLSIVESSINVPIGSQNIRFVFDSDELYGDYEIVVDGNNDGHYQSWADAVTPIEVVVP
ncbi:MAG: M4 family metallopeptidase, partial [Bdellovibrionales bacterium]|nr:M4 family metallopeptidase [Bdellovibrionales bacterium]